jgi:hypothetical protein
MVDYWYNIRAKSPSGAPFYLWPYAPKFELIRPLLIYRSRIGAADSIQTLIFPGRDRPQPNQSASLALNFRSHTLPGMNVQDLESELGLNLSMGTLATKSGLEQIERLAALKGVSRDAFTDAVSQAVYTGLVSPHLGSLPEALKLPVAGMLTQLRT